MLGACYYPEHWPEEWWAKDAQRMRELGIAYVRIGEFAWSRCEPRREEFAWGWLDRAIDALAAAGLKIVLGTPTATPPKWLMDEYPEIQPTDEEGRPRGFGSRRHYTFSSQAYRRESARIVEALAGRYGRHPALVGWQTDNEYGCHGTALSWGAEDLKAFRVWLRQNYQSPEQLNQAWGSAFWSMEVQTFDEVALPNLTVTEPNPAARLDYWRFKSEEVAAYDRMQCEIIRRHSPGRWITHNFMGFFNDFDHWRLADHLDFAAWDSYPIGLVERFPFSEPERNRWQDTSHPDVAAFHHDLYRGVGRGRFWVMEQQPGPVELGAMEPGARLRNGPSVDARSARPRRGGGQLFSLAAGFVRAGADACRAQSAGLTRTLAAGAARRRRRPTTLRGSVICPRSRLPTWRSSTTTRRTGSPRSSRKARTFAIASWSSAGTKRSGVSAWTSISCRRARA